MGFFFECKSGCYFLYLFKFSSVSGLVLLPGFQKGRGIKASYGKGQGAVVAKKGQVASYKEKRTEFHSF
jgi:hypothetical protein